VDASNQKELDPMKNPALALFGILTLAAAVSVSQTARPAAQTAIQVNKIPLPAKSKCLEATSSGSFSCKDSGNFASTCATAKCPAGYTLTGGGGACDAGDRKIKSLFPRFATGEFTIACEQQGVAPTAEAICCQL
jgi:hypothetical protein